jgi:hypothetical protein
MVVPPVGAPESKKISTLALGGTLAALLDFQGLSNLGVPPQVTINSAERRRLSGRGASNSDKLALPFVAAPRATVIGPARTLRRAAHSSSVHTSLLIARPASGALRLPTSSRERCGSIECAKLHFRVTPSLQLRRRIAGSQRVVHASSSRALRPPNNAYGNGDPTHLNPLANRRFMSIAKGQGADQVAASSDGLHDPDGASMRLRMNHTISSNGFLAMVRAVLEPQHRGSIRESAP